LFCEQRYTLAVAEIPRIDQVIIRRIDQELAKASPAKGRVAQLLLAFRWRTVLLTRMAAYKWPAI
jgi:hypothetical protein